MRSQRYIDPRRDLPAGYVQPHSADYTPSDRDYELGFCSYGECDLNDMFGAFYQHQYGVVGGDRTVDDFTPDGLDWHVGGATGNENRGNDGDDDDDDEDYERRTKRYP